MRPRPVLAAALAATGLALGTATGSAAPAGGADVVLVTRDCGSTDLYCPGFARAARRTGTRARVVSPDRREDVAGTFALLARQGHDLIISTPDLALDAHRAAARHPSQRFAVIDFTAAFAPPRPPNVALLEIRPREAAYLAGRLAGRMERLRRGPDVVGVVGGERIPPVDDFVYGYRAGARSAGVRVISGYSGSFDDPTVCTAEAERQIARGAHTVFDVAGECGAGTLEAVRAAGVWAIGVDRDRSGLGPFVLTSVVKRYDRAFALLMRQAPDRRLRAGRTIVMGLRRGGAELGRISPRVARPVLREIASVRRDLLAGRIRVPGPPGP
jgi:basic membrane protein A